MTMFGRDKKEQSVNAAKPAPPDAAPITAGEKIERLAADLALQVLEDMHRLGIAERITVTTAFGSATFRPRYPAAKARWGKR